MFEPNIFPNMIFVFPEIELVIEMINSGREVPKATMVKPMMAGLIFKAIASEEEPLISNDAPFIKMTRPNRNKNNGKIPISLFLL